jgi:hypothetical protein
MAFLARAIIASVATADYTNVWANVRGTNYVPSYSKNSAQTWLDYDPVVIDRELGFAETLGLNNVRIFLHMFPWVSDRGKFLANYDDFIARCTAHKIKPLIVVFDDDFFPVNATTSDEVKRWVKTGEYKTSKWMANPGSIYLDNDFKRNFSTASAFVKDIAGGKRANDPRILGYDIMNEPHRSDKVITGGLPAFIAQMLKLFAQTTASFTTVDDYAQAGTDLHQLESGISIHSYWEYGHWQDCASHAATACVAQAATGAQHLAQAKALQKPLLVSEMGQFDCYCPAATGFASAGVGWIMWELMMAHDQFFAFQGFVYANGTYRNPSEAACMQRLAAAKYAPVCPPNPPTPPTPPPTPLPPPPPPVYPGAGGCAKTNCTIIADTNTSFFTYSPPSSWTAWRGDGPKEHPTLHYCNKQGGSVAFVVDGGAAGRDGRSRVLEDRVLAAVDLVFKRGPDCGMMAVTVNDGSGRAGVVMDDIDTYSPSVDWESVVRIVPKKLADDMRSVALPAHEIEANLIEANLTNAQTITITVSGNKNPASTNAYVQIVSAHLFWKSSALSPDAIQVEHVAHVRRG